MLSTLFYCLRETAKTGTLSGMASTRENPPRNDDSVPCSRALSPQTLAFLILRLWIGAAAVAAGLAKFARSEKVFTENFETGETLAEVVRSYSLQNYVGAPAREFSQLLGDPLLPNWALHAFYYALGPSLVFFGATLLLGIATRTSLFALGLIFAALTFGLSLIDPSGSAGTLGIYALAVAAALALSDANRFCLTKRF